MNPTIFVVIGPGFLNQVPTLVQICLRQPSALDLGDPCATGGQGPPSTRGCG